MEIIQMGSEDLYALAVLRCCWPPGTHGLET